MYECMYVYELAKNKDFKTGKKLMNFRVMDLFITSD